MLKPRRSRLWSLICTLKTKDESAVVAGSPSKLDLDLDGVSMTGQRVPGKPMPVPDGSDDNVPTRKYVRFPQYICNASGRVSARIHPPRIHCQKLELHG